MSDDPSDWTDERLNRRVAEWLDVGPFACRLCAGSGEHMLGGDCERCSATGRVVPDYCGDDAAAWRLLERMPRGGQYEPDDHTIRVDFQGSRLVVNETPKEMVGLDETFPRAFDYQDGLKRALAEAAATLAERGVEPREVLDE